MTSTGRFIKKGSKILEVVTIESYSFEEIAHRKLIVPDNPMFNIIHSRFHVPEEIDTHLVRPSAFREDLERPKKPIQFPVDFTNDWEEAKRRSVRPKESYDDEEEYEQYLESLEEQDYFYKESSEKQELERKLRRDTPLDKLRSEPEPYSTDDKLKELQSTEYAPKNPIEIVKDAFSIVSPGPANQEPKPPEPSPIQETPTSEKITVSDNDFKEIQDKAKEQGYKEGLGEAVQLSQKIGEILSSLENMKKDVLSNIQDNFYEIVKALTQTIFEREIAASPETFAKIIRKTVSSLIDSEQFKVHLHPDDFFKLSSLSADTLKGKLISDPQVNVGNFRIETDLGIVDTGLKDIIVQLLEQTNLSLFDKEKDK